MLWPPPDWAFLESSFYPYAPPRSSLKCQITRPNGYWQEAEERNPQLHKACRRRIVHLRKGDDLSCTAIVTVIRGSGYGGQFVIFDIHSVLLIMSDQLIGLTKKKNVKSFRIHGRLYHSLAYVLVSRQGLRVGALLVKKEEIFCFTKNKKKMFNKEISSREYRPMSFRSVSN